MGFQGMYHEDGCLYLLVGGVLEEAALDEVEVLAQGQDGAQDGVLARLQAGHDAQ